MCPCIPRRVRLFYFLRPMLTSKFFFLVTCLSFSVLILWMQTGNEDEFVVSHESLAQEALHNVAQDSRYAAVYRKKEKLPKDLKYILLWTDPSYAPFYLLRNGQRAFIERNCPVINCFVTTDRNFFGGDLARFDAIGFNGRNILYMNRAQLPKQRAPHQKYIFFNMESADNYPICNEMFDDFFNWTSTYRLDSDIPIPYILIKNNEGQVVGPKKNMEWLDDMQEIDDEFATRLQNKSKIAAWFVSHCPSRSGRKRLVDELQKTLKKYDLDVDVYGKCGTLKCPRERQEDCNDMLERDYFFYLSLENSFSEDYVTEKLLTALKHNVVPIVYGGADYSRFLHPTSYIDASLRTSQELAEKMYSIMKNPEHYQRFFRWRNHYSYHDPTLRENVCAVCAALNDKTMMQTPTVYPEFRRWWYPDYHKRCR